MFLCSLRHQQELCVLRTQPSGTKRSDAATADSQQAGYQNIPHYTLMSPANVTTQSPVYEGIQDGDEYLLPDTAAAAAGEYENLVQLQIKEDNYTSLKL